MSAFASVAANEITAGQVHDTIARHMLADGFAFVLDIDASRGSQLVDARTGTSYLDLFTFFASSALGMNHPSLAGDAAFRDEVARFPKFDWPRIPAPAINGTADVEAAELESLAAARVAFEAHPNDIACFIAEPIQGEGGDNHFRPQFLQSMQALCRELDALFVLDEVQTGVGLTGTAWAYQQLGVQPDVVAFGKKTQVCGVMAGGRVDEVPQNVFAVSSRINSTWGGNLTDMVRARRGRE